MSINPEYQYYPNEPTPPRYFLTQGDVDKIHHLIWVLAGEVYDLLSEREFPIPPPLKDGEKR